MGEGRIDSVQNADNGHERYVDGLRRASDGPHKSFSGLRSGHCECLPWGTYFSEGWDSLRCWMAFLCPLTVVDLEAGME